MIWSASILSKQEGINTSLREGNPQPLERSSINEERGSPLFASKNQALILRNIKLEEGNPHL